MNGSDEHMGGYPFIPQENIARFRKSQGCAVLKSPLERC